MTLEGNSGSGIVEEWRRYPGEHRRVLFGEFRLRGSYFDHYFILAVLLMFIYVRSGSRKANLDFRSPAGFVRSLSSLVDIVS